MVDNQTELTDAQAADAANQILFTFRAISKMAGVVAKFNQAGREQATRDAENQRLKNENAALQQGNADLETAHAKRLVDLDTEYRDRRATKEKESGDQSAILTDQLTSLRQRVLDFNQRAQDAEKNANDKMADLNRRILEKTAEINARAAGLDATIKIKTDRITELDADLEEFKKEHGLA